MDIAFGYASAAVVIGSNGTNGRAKTATVLKWTTGFLADTGLADNGIRIMCRPPNWRTFMRKWLALVMPYGFVSWFAQRRLERFTIPDGAYLVEPYPGSNHLLCFLK
jgi:hypothetical protein